jgi:hypothetical protein
LRTIMIDNCQLITFPKIVDTRGNLSFVESGRQAPFQIARVYWLYDVPSGAERGGHSHKALEQILVCLAGSFDVTLDDGFKRSRIQLNRPHSGLYICPMIWRTLDNFSSGSVCMVLASEFYSEADYYRNYDDFVRAVRSP